MRHVASAAALVGGLCLVLRLFVDVSALSWVGVALLAAAIAVVGAGLVRAPWLAVVSAVGSVALAGAVLAVLHDAAPDRPLDAVVGVLAVVCATVTILRRPRRGDAPARPGNHRS